MIITDSSNKIKYISKYKVLKTLYLGNLSQVYLVENSDGKICVVKAIKNSYNIKKILNELNTLRKLNNQKNIVKLNHVFRDSKIYFFVFDYYEDGDLETKVKKEGVLEVEEIISVLRDMLNVLKQLKKANIIHKDIKSGNIFQKNNNYFLADWGLAENKSVINTLHIQSDDEIISPEMYRGIYSFESDIYSLGCTLFYLATGKVVYEIDKNSSYAYKMYAHSKLDINLELVKSSKLREIIYKMTIKEPKNRATIDEIEKLLTNQIEVSFDKLDVDYTKYKFLEPIELYKQLEKDDNLFAINNLGLLYEIEKNFILAKEKYEYAANKGLTKAMYNLALCYYRGKGIQKDDEKAYQWIEKASVKGHEKAQFLLGSFYENGVFVNKNTNKAKSLYLVSAKNGCKEAHKKINLLNDNNI